MSLNACPLHRKLLEFVTSARISPSIFEYSVSMFAFRPTALPLIVSLLLGSIGAVSVGHADIYKYVDQQGRVYYTNRPPHDGYRLILKSRKSWQEPRIDYRNMEKNRQRFATTIASVAQKNKLPEGLIHAVIRAESAYDPNAVSRSGAVGLMQLMPDTARRYGITNRRNPSDNISGGTRYLKDLLERFDNNLELALAGYNAGERMVEKYGNQVPPFVETRSYVRKVMKLFQQYPKLANDA